MQPASQNLTGKLVRPDAIRVTGKDAGRFRLKSGDTPEHHFPRAAKKEGWEAVVSVDLLLNERGEVLEAQIIRESPSGLGFGLAALDTAKTFVYENPLKKLVLMSIDITFLP